MKPYAEWFYNSTSWRALRNAYAKSAKHLCEDCLAKGLTEAGVIVHHINPITPDNIHDTSVTLNWDNLVLLCRSCHEKRHRGVELRYSFDENGNVIR